ncbi:hypothetical protein HPP92_003201 [Vanilla planifolia]|uniref:Non-specific phospholipase C2 n=1 Tax=Vanilla planifolia TaxID=51239 RepID=A0A835S7P1_VANPL|nr:hypothetical protein HPP92_003201 [Vanilla planifolia]
MYCSTAEAMLCETAKRGLNGKMMEERQGRWRSNSMHSVALSYAVIVLVAGATLQRSASLPIKTVVVVVMENRSFDHMLGWMKRLNPEIDGVDGTEWNPTSTTDPNAARVYFKDGSQYVDPDPGHSFQAIREQIFGSNDTSASPPPMNGFVQQAASMSANMTDAVMNGFPPEMVAVYQALVSEFAVFDRWFAAVPASTQPNRLYVHSATSHGATSNDAGLLALGFPQRTIFDNIDEAEFKLHARSGKLPNYAVIEQRYMDSKLKPATDDHPSHDIYQGQMFIKEIYETLRSSPHWNETLLIITYDEHGGFYDHVATPVNGIPSPDGIVGPNPFNFNFNRLGVRVPTIMVSPWIEKGTVVHGPNGSPTPTSEYEHSSIPATVKKIFNLPSPYLTKRDAWAGTFDAILQTRTEPRTNCPMQLPIPVKIRKSEANEQVGLSEFQQELVQLASVINGDHLLKNFHHIIKQMNVREGSSYVEDSVKRFLDAGLAAKRIGGHEEQIVKMRPSLTSRRPVSALHP